MKINTLTIKTKLYQPRVSQNLVPRPWLVETFREERKRPLTMVVAPAGYGKTILMATIAEGQTADGAQQIVQMLVGFLTLAADLLAGTLGRKFIFRSSKVLTDTWQVAITQGYPTITPYNDFIRGLKND